MPARVSTILIWLRVMAGMSAPGTKKTEADERVLPGRAVDHPCAAARRMAGYRRPSATSVSPPASAQAANSRAQPAGVSENESRRTAWPGSVALSRWPRPLVHRHDHAALGHAVSDQRGEGLGLRPAGDEHHQQLARAPTDSAGRSASEPTAGRRERAPAGELLLRPRDQSLVAGQHDRRPNARPRARTSFQRLHDLGDVQRQLGHFQPPQYAVARWHHLACPATE